MGRRADSTRPLKKMTATASKVQPGSRCPAPRPSILRKRPRGVRPSTAFPPRSYRLKVEEHLLVCEALPRRPGRTGQFILTCESTPYDAEYRERRGSALAGFGSVSDGLEGGERLPRPSELVFLIPWHRPCLPRERPSKLAALRGGATPLPRLRAGSELDLQNRT